ncbi:MULTISPECIES: pilus assembly protein N-terminal domain-containing protein [unclassified Burkholderia]|uniref:type II and III secretion system protein family protein n=2 Tax=Burkholderia TaxID=32008 RepID=UPI00158BA09F|nr:MULTISPECIES: pilus assembly protein N-terminal domain-containing protein [unclassified Burkholderia]
MKVIDCAAERRSRVLSCALAGVLAAQGMPQAFAAPRINHEEHVAPARAAVLDLYRGEIRMIDVPGQIKRIAIGDGTLVTANVVDGRLMLLAEKPGITSLVVWTTNGVAVNTTVRIAKGNVHETAAQLRLVLVGVPGVQVVESGPNIVLTGTVHRDMLGRIKAATVDVPNLLDATIVDEGDALKKTIHFKVQIMELTRNAQENLGIQWDQKIAGPQAGAQGFIGSQAATAAGMVFAGISTQITSMINLMVNNGDAYVLASPELNTKSGGTASFLAGGQVPIPRAGALGTTDVEYKDYGIKLNIKPVVDANNVISAQIDTEISQIDPSVSYGGYPGFLTRSARSDISLRAGETMAISGLINADAIGNASRVPFLGRLPIIGRLFRSDEFRSKRSDLVILVTPLISDPTLAPNTDMLARANLINRGFHDKHGDPSPLADDSRGSNGTLNPIGPTRPQQFGPVRVQPAPLHAAPGGDEAGASGPAGRGDGSADARPASADTADERATTGERNLKNARGDFDTKDEAARPARPLHTILATPVTWRPAVPASAVDAEAPGRAAAAGAP